MYNAIPTISFPIVNAYDNVKVRNNNYEQLLINSDLHKFDTDDVKKLLYKSSYLHDKESQIEQFIREFNATETLWRPIDYIREQNGYQLFTVNLIVNYTSSGLIHTGPWPMMIGDYVYCLPPLQSITSMFGESVPFCYKLNRDGDIYSNPMLVNRQIAQEFIRDWLTIQLYSNLKNDDDDEGVTEKVNIKSEISKEIGSENLLLIQNATKLKPLGQIVRKQDEYGNSNEVKSGDRFVIKWFNT